MDWICRMKHLRNRCSQSTMYSTVKVAVKGKTESAQVELIHSKTVCLMRVRQKVQSIETCTTASTKQAWRQLMQMLGK